MCNKRRITTLLVLGLTVFLGLTSCKLFEKKQPQTPIVPTAVPTEIPQKTWSELAPQALLAYEQTEISGIYHIKELDLPENTYCSSIAVHEQYIAMITMRFSETEGQIVRMNVFDLSEKEMLLDVPMEEDTGTVGFLSDNSLYVQSMNSGHVTVYDLAGEVLQQYEHVIGSGNIFADEQDRLWLFGDTVLYCLHQGQVTTYDVAFAGFGAQIMSVENGVVCYEYYGNQSEIAVYNTDTGEARLLELCTGFSAGSGVCYQGIGEGTFAYALDAAKAYRTSFGEDEYVDFADWMDGLLYLKMGEGFTVLNPEKKEIGELHLTDIYPGIHGQDGEAIVFVGLAGESQQIYYIRDYSITYTPIDIEEYTLSEPQQSNVERAAQLYKRYGVYVETVPLKAEAPINYDYKNVNDVTDTQMSDFLDVFEQLLQEYPEKFFHAMTAGKVDAVRVMLCNGLEGTADNTLSVAGGLSFATGETIYLAVTTDEVYNGGLRRVLAHELLHVIESAMRIDNPEQEPFEQWHTLNPEGFYYQYDYTTDYWITDKYVYDFTEEHLDQTWFAATYGIINELEDRATIFEDMVIGDELLFQAPHIQDKANYLVEVTKAYYPEWYEGEAPIWLNYQK